MGSFPREAREGLMRAWLDILQKRHPELTWVPAEMLEQDEEQDEGETSPLKQ